jgi:hypothetical protein
MMIKDLDNVISEILEQETKKLIKEQVEEVNHLVNSVKNFQSLSGLADKINEIEDAGTDGTMIYISIKDLKPEELVHCCGGKSLGEAQKNLMQGLHHDLEDNGFGSDFDVDIDTAGDENSLHLTIRITPNKDKSLTDMKEQTKDTNPTAKDKKDVILGGKEMEEQWEEAAADVLEPAIKDAATQFISGKIQDKLNDSDEEVDESDDKWMQKAVNPKHKGFCTPMTKPTCTKKRKALAKTFKKMAKNESTNKKIITLSETEMKDLIAKILKEAIVAPSGGVLPGGVPGLDITKQVHHLDGEENDAALKAIEAKIKKYLSFEGNDNPEFPNQIGQGDEKKARVNSEEQDEVVADNRGRGPQDLDYDNSDPNTGEPPKEFKERLKMSLIGDPKMGNSQDAAGVIKTKTGEKILKNMERRKKNYQKEPIYPKENVPMKTTAKTEEELRPVNEEIKRMKQMLLYNEKTQ